MPIPYIFFVSIPSPGLLGFGSTLPFALKDFIKSRWSSLRSHGRTVNLIVLNFHGAFKSMYVPCLEHWLSFPFSPLLSSPPWHTLPPLTLEMLFLFLSISYLVISCLFSFCLLRPIPSNTQRQTDCSKNLQLYFCSKLFSSLKDINTTPVQCISQCRICYIWEGRVVFIISIGNNIFI